jgi:hypothetical protein
VSLKVVSLPLAVNVGGLSDMDGGWALVVAAVVTAVGAILVAILDKFRKENSRDHEVVVGMLRMVYKSMQRTEEKVDRVDERLTEHLSSHAHGKVLDNGATVHKTRAKTNRRVSS